MAYPAGTAKIVIGGTISSGEQFAFGYQVKLPGDAAQFALTNLVGSATAALQNNFLVTGVKSAFPATTVFQTLRGYLYTGGASAAFTSASTGLNIAGTAAGNPLPMQCALVASLETGVPGRSYRGRMYLPPLTSGNLTAQGQVTSGTCSVLADALKSMFQAVNATSSVSSQVVVSSATKASSTAVIRVRIDSILDTQRRRRNKALPSTSYAANL